MNNQANLWWYQKKPTQVSHIGHINNEGSFGIIGDVYVAGRSCSISKIGLDHIFDIWFSSTVNDVGIDKYSLRTVSDLVTPNPSIIG